MANFKYERDIGADCEHRSYTIRYRQGSRCAGPAERIKVDFQPVSFVVYEIVSSTLARHTEAVDYTLVKVFILIIL